MLTRLSYRINLTLERYFPEQRLFLKSDETTRFIRLIGDRNLTRCPLQTAQSQKLHYSAAVPRHH